MYKSNLLHIENCYRLGFRLGTTSAKKFDILSEVIPKVAPHCFGCTGCAEHTDKADVISHYVEK